MENKMENKTLKYIGESRDDVMLRLSTFMTT